MSYLTVLLISIALGIDAFSVAVSIGLTGVRTRQMLTVIGIVTIFHILMPLLGLNLGAYLGQIAGPMASSIGALVLIAIGLSTIWDNVKELRPFSLSGKQNGTTNPKQRGIINISSPVSLTLMAASVSLDALTVGFGLGALRYDLYLTVVTMGIVAGVMTAGGLLFGRGLNRTFGDKAEIFGGFILVTIGLKLLF